LGRGAAIRTAVWPPPLIPLLAERDFHSLQVAEKKRKRTEHPTRHRTQNPTKAATALWTCAQHSRGDVNDPPPLRSALAATHRFGFLRTVAGHDLDPRPDEKAEKFRNCKDQRSPTLLFAFGAGSAFFPRPTPRLLFSAGISGWKAAAWGRWCRIDLLDLKMMRLVRPVQSQRSTLRATNCRRTSCTANWRTEPRLLRLSLSSIYGLQGPLATDSRSQTSDSLGR
jgi:hypothetical protein